MFYAHFVLSKKGPLARIWLAAHWDKKLTKAHVFETNISSSVEAILEPKVKMALRTSGHLLLGVVRIYSRKAKYLLADCNEAFVKIKMAFRPGVVDLPEDMNREAAIAAITLPENFHDFEATMSDLAELDKNSINVNQSRPEDITMREDFGEINLGRPDDDFGDSAFDDTQAASQEQLREAGESRIAGEVLPADVTSILDGTDKTVNSSKRSGVGDGASGVDDLLDDGVESPGAKRRRTDQDRGAGSGPDTPREAAVDGGRQDAVSAGVDDDDDFGDEMGPGFLAPDDDDDAVDDDFGGEMDHDLFGAGIFDDPSAQKQLEHITSEFESHLDPRGFNLDVAGGATPARTPATPRPGVHDGAAAIGELGQPGVTGQSGQPDPSHPAVPATAGELMPPPSGTLTDSVVGGVGGTGQPSALMSNDGEAFTLPPVDATAVSVNPSGVSATGIGLNVTAQNTQPASTPSAPTRTRHTAKRKRKLIIDEQKSIPSEVMKLQMSDTSDIISSLDLAPPTKKLMFWKETGSVEKLFAMPGRAIVSRSLLRLFTRNLLTTPLPDLEEDMVGSGGGGATPATHRVPVSAGSGPGQIEQSVTDEEATAAMLLGNETRLPPVSEQPAGVSVSVDEPIEGLRAAAEMQGVPVSAAPAEMTTILEESSNVGLSSSVLHSQATSVLHPQSVTSMVEPGAGIGLDQDMTAEQNRVHGMAELANKEHQPQSPSMTNNHVTQDATAEVTQQEPPREDPMMPVVPRPQDTPHPTDYFAPETPAPYLNPPSILSMGPPSVLPADAAEEEGLLGTGAVARQLEREYEEAEEEMRGIMEKEMDENANQEMFEERRLERRSKVMLKMLRAALESPESEYSFDNMVLRNNRKQAASKFYTLLVLRKQKAVELTQDVPYGDILISQGSAYQSLLATAF